MNKSVRRNQLYRSTIAASVCANMFIGVNVDHTVTFLTIFFMFNATVFIAYLTGRSEVEQ